MQNQPLIAEGDNINGQSIVVVKGSGKLEQLNEAQVAHMATARNYWLNYIFSCRNHTDKEKAKKGIEWLYKFCKIDPPAIVFMDSPFGCQVAAHFFKNVRDNVRDNVGANEIKYESFSSYGNIGDYGWVAFYDYFMQLGVADKNVDFDAFKELLLSGVFDMIQLKGMCIVSDMPVKIVRNTSGRLHNPSGPAIEFKDGYGQYYINGRALPSWIWEKAEKGEITKEMFTKEPNSDIKGGIYEVLGQKRMMDMLGAKEIDQQTIAHKNGDLETITLFKTEDTFPEIDNQPFAWVRMVCPSTGTQYLQGVESKHTDALAAIASLSMFKPKEYSFTHRS